jgi:hypothetical protein
MSDERQSPFTPPARPTGNIAADLAAAMLAQRDVDVQRNLQAQQVQAEEEARRLQAELTKKVAAEQQAFSLDLEAKRHANDAAMLVNQTNRRAFVRTVEQEEQAKRDAVLLRRVEENEAVALSLRRKALTRQLVWGAAAAAVVVVLGAAVLARRSP